MAKNSKLTPREGALSSTTPARLPQGFLASPLAHLLILAFIAVAAYGNTFHVPFVFDDDTSIVNNPVVKDLPAFLSGAGYAYNPRRFIGYLSFALNYAMGGLDVAGYHAVNLAVHIISGWLVYALVRLTFKTPFFEGRNEERGTRSEEQKNLGPRTSNLVPLFAALLFVAHPVQTQAVTYIVQRLASLATMFYLLALVLYVRARLVQEETGKLFPPPALALYVFSLGAAVAAMRTKEIAATLPVVALLYEFSFFGASARKRLIVLIPLLLTILIVPLGMLQAGKPLGELLSDVSEMARESRLISRGDYLLTQFSVIVTYIRLLILPVSQNLDYDYPVYHSLFTPRVFLSFILLSSLIGVAVWLYYRSGREERETRNEKREHLEPQTSDLNPRTSRLISFGILWFFITLSVESSVIPITDVIFEHRLYLPSVGAFMALIAGAAFLLRKHSLRALGIAVTAVVVILTATTWHRNVVWGNNLTLWRDAAAKSPNKYRPHNNLGNALLLEEKVDEAIAEFRTALALKPEDAESYCNLGVAYFKKGWTDRAIEQYMTAVRLNPDFAPAHNNLGEAYNRKGLSDKAIESYQVAVTLKPDFAEAHNNLGAAYFRKGWTDRAIEKYRSALMLKPKEGNFHFNLGIAYEKKGWPEKAIGEYRLAVTLLPGGIEALRRLEALSGKDNPGIEDAPAVDASINTDEYYSNLGLALNKEGKPDDAIKNLQIALRLNPNNARSHNTLGSAYWKKGLKELAMQQFLLSIQQDPKLADAHSNLGAAYGEKGLIDQAIEHLEIAVKLNRDDAKTLSNLGAAYAIKGLTDQAIGHFEAAIALDPKSPGFHLNLANAYAAKGWSDRAEKERSIAGKLEH